MDQQQKNPIPIKIVRLVPSSSALLQSLAPGKLTVGAAIKKTKSEQKEKRKFEVAFNPIDPNKKPKNSVLVSGEASAVHLFEPNETKRKAAITPKTHGGASTSSNINPSIKQPKQRNKHSNGVLEEEELLLSKMVKESNISVSAKPKKRRQITPENVTLWDIFSSVQAGRAENKMFQKYSNVTDAEVKQKLPFQLPMEKSDLDLCEEFIQKVKNVHYS